MSAAARTTNLSVGPDARTYSAGRPPAGGLHSTEVAASRATMHLLQLDDGAPIELRAARRSAWARVRVHDAVPSDELALGFELWGLLQVRPGAQVGVVPAERHPTDADKIVVRTPAAVHEHDADTLRDLLASGEELAFPGARPWISSLGFAVEVLDSEPSPALVRPTTRIELVRSHARDQDLEGFGDLGGLDGVIEQLRDEILLPLTDPGLYRRLGIRPIRGVLLHGPPGTGKTLTCRVLARELGANVYLQDVTALVGSYPGETEKNLRALFHDASHARPALIVLDEVDVLAGNRQRLASQSDVRAASQLLELLDGLSEVDGVVVVGTTNRLSTIDPAFRRPGRFDSEVPVPVPDARARREILEIHTRAMPLSGAAVAHLDAVAERTAGSVGADLMSLARMAALCALRRLRDGADDLHPGDGPITVEPEDLDQAIPLVCASLLRDDPGSSGPSWEALFGHARQRAMLLALARRALDPAAAAAGDGVLLHGPAGSGKTALVSALAREVGANLVVVEPARVFNQWLGESEVALATLFDRAFDVRPTIVAIDHLEAIAPDATTAASAHAARRVTAALLAAIDRANREPGVFLVGLTRVIDAVDEGVIVRGRLGTHIELGLPDGPDRRSVIETVLGPGEPQRAQDLEEETDGFTFGALLARLNAARDDAVGDDADRAGPAELR